MVQEGAREVRGRMLRLPEVLERVGGSKTWWYALIARGEAPEPIRYSLRHVVWHEAAIDAWIAGQVKAASSPVRVKP